MLQFTDEQTQYKRWTFTRDALDAVRRDSYEKHSREALHAIAEERRLQGTEGELPVLPTPEEHKALISHYSLMLRRFCGGKEIRFPDNVRAAAMMYFSRFYLLEAAWDYAPRDVLLTSALLASKAENFHTDLPTLLQISNPPDASVVVNLEFDLCRVLKVGIWWNLRAEQVVGSSWGTISREFGVGLNVGDETAFVQTVLTPFKLYLLLTISSFCVLSLSRISQLT
jgi:hypothetical protein